MRIIGKGYSDYYLAFCETDHGRRYWRIGGDKDTVAETKDINELIQINANNEDDAEEIARNMFQLNLWDKSNWYVKSAPEGDFVNDIDWDAVAEDMSFKISDSLSIGYCTINDDLFAARSSDGKKLLILGYHEIPYIVDANNEMRFVFP